MPDCITHAYLAEDVYKKIKPAVDYNYFIVGSQGADPLFYYNYLPWKSSKEASKIAGLIHKKNTKAFLDELLKLAKNGSSKIKGFALGFLTHYALDTTAHPYIYYVTGNYSKDTKQYRGNHLRLERGIDNILVKERGHNPRFYKTVNHFPLTRLNDEFIQTINQVMEKAHNINNVGNLFADAYLDFKSNMKYLAYDPFGLKSKIYSLADKLTDSAISYRSISFYQHIKHDIMNRQNNVWKHPVTGVDSTESFDDLYKKALDKASNLIRLSLDYFNNLNENIFKETKNVSYDTNLDCNENQKMIYIQSIFN